MKDSSDPATRSFPQKIPLRRIHHHSLVKSEGRSKREKRKNERLYNLKRVKFTFSCWESEYQPMTLAVRKYHTFENIFAFFPNEKIRLGKIGVKLLNKLKEGCPKDVYRMLHLPIRRYRQCKRHRVHRGGHKPCQRWFHQSHRHRRRLQQFCKVNPLPFCNGFAECTLFECACSAGKYSFVDLEGRRVVHDVAYHG